MNWQRGLFRVWIALSSAWVTLIGWITYEAVLKPRYLAHKASECAEAREVDPTLGNVFDCFADVPNIFADIVPLGPEIWPYLVLAVAPPVAIFAVGLMAKWILSGFKGPPTN